MLNPGLSDQNEISFRTRPEVALERFRETGYHVERALVPEPSCDEVVTFAESLANATDGSYRPIPMPHRDHPAFLSMMKYQPIVEIVEKLVGGRPSGLGGEYFYMRPGTPGWFAHQDNHYIQAPPDAAVSVWTALCEVGPENGGLVFYPGSHKLGMLPTRTHNVNPGPGQNPSAQAIECLLPKPVAPVEIRVEKGSVVFFHPLLVHRSENNRSARFRYSLLFTYIRTGSPFRPGFTQKRQEIPLD